MDTGNLKAEVVLLGMVILSACIVVIVQTVQTGHPPAWFESSVIPVIIASLMSIKLGVEKTIIRLEHIKEEDKDACE